MKLYSEPELEIVCFEAADVTNFDEGEDPGFNGDDLSKVNPGWYIPGF